MKKWLVIGILAVTTLSCQWVRKLSDGASELLGDEVIARVGEHKLFRSELEKVLPGGLDEQDSLSLSREYIHRWAGDLLLLDMADQQLSKAEKDVSKELEEYRRSLLKYRYEQHYVSERLDTAIREEEMKAYYDAHPEKFLLTRPLVKCRILIIPSSAKSVKTLRRLMASDDGEDLVEADSLSRMTAIRYLDASDTWMDANDVAKYFGMEYSQLLSLLWGNTIRYEPADRADLMFAYVCDIRRSGPAPLDYCAPQIRDILMSVRKHDLMNSLERDLLDNALESKNFVVYKNEE